MQLPKKIKGHFSNLFKPKEKKIKIEATGLQITKELIILAISLQIILEILSNRSIITGLLTTVTNPLMFVCSSLILACFLSISLLLPKRHLGYLIVSVVWLWLGFTNFILLSYRTTPLTATDFKMLSSVITVINRYLNTFQMILVGIFALCILLGMIHIAKKLPYTKFKFRQLFLATSLSFLLVIGSFNVALTANAVSTNFGNIANAFLDYGFVYSFSTSVIDKGIKRPKNYSPEKVGDVLDALAMDEIEKPEVILSTPDDYEIQLDQYLAQYTIVEPEKNKEPNIIFIQLESFFDVKRLKALDYNHDPLPNITNLSENFSSGFVTVPSIGAGTANTEFEILSGMSLDYFGAGEYPYKTILKETTVESIAYTLDDYGYHNHAIHNNMGTFYARAYVYPRLGFDSFSSIEYMNDLTYTPLDWSKDEVLTPEIIKALKWTPEQDFVFAVSVQPHGQYPEDTIIENPYIIPRVISEVPDMINHDTDQDTSASNNDDTLDMHSSSDEADKVSDMPETNSNDSIESKDNDPEVETHNDMATDPNIDAPLSTEYDSADTVHVDQALYNKYLYYVNQIYETDLFVGELIEALESLDEPTVLVLYGDHMPSLNITEADLNAGTPFQIEYVVWDNMGLEEKDEDLMAYQLNSSVLESLGYNNGILNRFHQTMDETAEYEEELQLLQYDMLYGDQNVYGGKNPHKKKKMKMGVEPILINSVEQRGETIVVSGENFTKWSEVFINKEQQETLFYNSSMIIVPYIELEDGMSFKVSQMTVTGRKLSSTKTFKVEEPVPLPMVDLIE